MALNDDLQKEVATIFRSVWERRDGLVVPSDDSIKLGNDAVEIEATVLYADLADSTKLVDRHTPPFSRRGVFVFFCRCARMRSGPAGRGCSSTACSARPER